MVADGSMTGDADAYVLLSDSSKACIVGEPGLRSGCSRVFFS